MDRLAGGRASQREDRFHIPTHVWMYYRPVAVQTVGTCYVFDACTDEIHTLTACYIYIIVDQGTANQFDQCDYCRGDRCYQRCEKMKTKKPSGLNKRSPNSLNRNEAQKTDPV